MFVSMRLLQLLSSTLFTSLDQSLLQFFQDIGGPQLRLLENTRPIGTSFAALSAFSFASSLSHATFSSILVILTVVRCVVGLWLLPPSSFLFSL